MENLHLEGSAKTPSIRFDAAAGKLELKGRSIPENSVEFYKPLNEWIDAYGKSPIAETAVDVKLEYFNTSSSKCILDLFKKLESISGERTKVTVNWYFEEDDEDMEEAGQEFSELVEIPFEFKTY